MAQKGCDPKCPAKCNKKRTNLTSNKACDPRCTSRCNKKNEGTMPEENSSPIISSITKLDVIDTEDIKLKPTLLQPGDVKFVIMDLDGLILDIETVYQWVIKDLANRYGIPPSEVDTIIDLQDEETSKKICSDYNLQISPKNFMTEFRKTSIKLLAKTPLMPGIERLVDYFLKYNFPVAVASTSNKEAFQLKTKEHKKFFRKFCHIVLGGSDPDIDTRKPSPKIYEVCGSRFPSNPDPKNILVLEDAPDGVIAAKSAQMNVLWFPNKYMNRENNNGALAVYDSIEKFNPEELGLPKIN